MPRGGTWGYCGGWGSNFFFPKFNQIWCVSYSHEWHMHRLNFLGPRPLGPWGGVKNLIFWTWSCVISNERGLAVDHNALNNFNLLQNWWPWDGVKGSITIRFLRERGDLRWRAIECVLVLFGFKLWLQGILIRSYIMHLYISLLFWS